MRYAMFTLRSTGMILLVILAIIISRLMCFTTVDVFAWKMIRIGISKEKLIRRDEEESSEEA